MTIDAFMLKLVKMKHLSPKSRKIILAAFEFA
jgi:hypothetical protein